MEVDRDENILLKLKNKRVTLNLKKQNTCILAIKFNGTYLFDIYPLCTR